MYMLPVFFQIGAPQVFQWNILIDKPDDLFNHTHLEKV